MAPRRLGTLDFCSGRRVAGEHLGGGAVTQERGPGSGSAFSSREQLRGDGTDRGDLQTCCA